MRVCILARNLHYLTIKFVTFPRYVCVCVCVYLRGWFAVCCSVLQCVATIRFVTLFRHVCVRVCACVCKYFGVQCSVCNDVNCDCFQVCVCV